MIERLKTKPGFLFFSILYRSDLHSESDLHLSLETKFGSGSLFHPTHNPLFEYYTKEMGSSLARFFFVPLKLYPRQELLNTKLASLDWERAWCREDKRMVNVDVGFLSPENFLLATTKNYSHRVFLGEDIFADLTYQFQNGKFHTFPWTYPDYLDQEKIDFLSQERLKLLKLLTP
jgi:hypothetical protein